MDFLGCRSEVCCHGCSGQNNLLSAIAEAFSSEPSLVDTQVELEFGHVDGTLLRYPTPEPASDCTTEDSNLQSVLRQNYNILYID